MDSVRTLPVPEWMNAAPVRAVMAALGEGRALFVGGCVRDWVLGRTAIDLDIATVLTPDAVMAALDKAKIKWVATGIDHGTIMAVADGHGFEITTLRKDVSTDGRRATVAFTDQWEEDAARRDFTVNALYADEKGNVYDPLAQGLVDLAKERLRFVGDPAARIAEDYLRILRYFRFLAQLSWLPDYAALAACEAAAPKMAGLSKERITQEMLKLLAADEPAMALEIMQARHILPDLLAGVKTDTVRDLESANPLTRLFLLKNPGEALVLSNDQKKHLAALEEGLAAVGQGDEKSIKRLVYDHGNDMACEIYALWCAVKGENPHDGLTEIAREWTAPVFPLTGNDLIAQGIKPGPDLGAELKRREEEWMDKNF